MTSTADHIEVAPRMWDKTIAANYVKKVKSEVSVDTINKNDQPIDQQPMPSLFTNLKKYLLPAIFVFSIIIVCYVLWKYFTKYRNAKIESKITTISEKELAPPIEPSKNKINPAAIIASEDLSKYEYDSDDEQDNKKEKFIKTIYEEEESKSDESGDESDSDGSDEDNTTEDGDSGNESEVDDNGDQTDGGDDVYEIDEFNSEYTTQSDVTPDLSHIQQLILNEPMDDNIAMLEDPDEFTTTYSSTEYTTKTKRSRKQKRVTL